MTGQWLDVTKTVTSQIMQDLRHRLSRRILGRDPVWPYMKPREVEIVLDLLCQLRPKRILEWGAGYGTLYFTRRYSEFDAWVSIEHTEEWARRVRGLNTDSRVEIVTPENYVEYPAARGAFDLILVDGLERNLCLQRSPQYLTGDGVVILHDAGRRGYHPPRGWWSDSRYFLDYRKEGGLWIASRRAPLEEVLDLPHHTAVWRFFGRYGRQINWVYGPGIFSRWREVF